MAGKRVHRLDITSIGDASPTHVAHVARKRMGLSMPVVLRALYQAPATLVSRLPAATAMSAAEELRAVGCEVAVVDRGAPEPEPQPLVDVAVEVTDLDRFDDITAAAAHFLGASQDRARGLLLSTPPVLLGRVSPATVEALRAKLGDGLELTTSDPERAHYDLLLGDCHPTLRARLVTNLRKLGFEPEDDGLWVLRDLTREQAKRIWSKHKKIPNLQLPNRDFYRYEPRDDGEPELVTFRRRVVRVLQWPSAPEALDVLGMVGVEIRPREIPFTLGPWPELAARLVHRLLVRAGAEAELADE